MKILFFAFIIVAFALLQTSILIFDAKADFLLISVLMASLFFEWRPALLLSILAGILKDIFSAHTFGISAALFPLWSLLIIKLSKKVPLDNNYILMALIFIIANVNDITVIGILLFLGNFIYWGSFLRTAFIGSLYTTLILPLALKIIRRANYENRYH